MAITTINATIQMRRGNEVNFDPDQMVAGEWAVSTDSKKVWMCFAPGIVRRMATYEAFEEDMRQIQEILATCQDIQDAVKAFENLAEQHKDNAAESAQNAADSEAAAKASEKNAEESATEAADSAQDAATSAADAKNSGDAAKISEDNAKSYMDASKVSEDNAADSAESAAASSTQAGKSKDVAAESAMQAEQSKRMAAESKVEAEEFSRISKSYAVGTGGDVRENDDVDSSKGYYELAKRLAQGYNGIIPMGSITFADLADPENQVPKYMFNISDSFVSDERFQDGGGIFYGAGNNVVYTANGMWDVLAASMVSGVKGEAETEYRQGFINVTKENLGIGNATAKKTGLVKPDGTTVTVDESGTLSVADVGTIDYNELENKPSINGKTLTGNKTLELLGGASVVRLTKAEYDALPDSKLTDGKVYLIDDGSEDNSAGGGGNGGGIPTSGGVSEIKVVSALPSDAASHPDILYVIPQ